MMATCKNIVTVTFEIDSTLAAVSPAVERIVTFCKERLAENDVTNDLILQQIELSTTEAITNIVKHAYGPDKAGSIAIAVEFVSQQFVITLRDYGREIPGGIQDLGLKLEFKDDASDLPTHGMGWFLIKSDMDFVEYARKCNENQLVLIKHL